MAKGPVSLFNPKPSRPTLPKKESPSTNTPSPGPSQSTPGTPRKPATASPRPPPARRPAPPAPKPKPAEEAKPAPPEGPFSEFRLMSSKLNGWKYDVMKFESRKKVDINRWAQPVKLNRKEPRREDAGGAAGAGGAGQAVSAMVGSDGKLVVGADGKVVMVDAAGRPVRPDAAAAAAAAAAGGEGKDGKGKDKKKRFQKKTRQVFLVPEETRQLRREERFPWVIEDSKGEEVWVGKMEEVAKSQTYGMFMPAADDVFKFVPAHRWYKFQKKPHYHVPNLEEAETLMNKMQKHKDTTHWTLRQKTEQAASGSSLVYNASQSLGPGGRKLKAVDSGTAELFGDDDDDDGSDRKRKFKRELGAEGFLDELDFEESFADDEEKMEVDDKEDEEAKELEERLKKEYKNANKLREGYIDESDEEDDEAKLTGAGKNLQKTLKKLEKDGGYDDSDDEKNPYASEEEEEEEEEEVPIPTGPAIQPPEPKPGVRSASQPSSAGKPPANGQAGVAVKAEPASASSPPLSRPTSPAPTPGHGGHSVFAKRATSPKVPKPKTGIASRAGSPLASPNGVSPPASRATSPSAASPPGSAPPSGGAKPLKRKATDDGTGAAGGAGGAGSPGAAPRPKKRKAQLPPGAELEDRMVIEWLRNTPNATTRECILHFTPYLTTEEKKNKFTALVKEVAQLSKGVLVLRPAYRGTAAAPSPAAG